MRERARVGTSAALGFVFVTAVPGGAAQGTSQQAHPAMHHAALSAAHPPALVAQLDEVRRATERFRDHAIAVAEGYVHVGGDGPLMGEHWVRPDLTDRPFDITEPSTLQYFDVNGTRVLTGVAYTVYRSPDQPLPEGFVGEADEWHVHNLLTTSMAVTEERPLVRWITNRRIEKGRTQWSRDRPELTMVHAWVWLENPDGVFAQDHRAIPYLRAGLPLTLAEDASAEAAYGVALLDENACDEEVRRTNFLAAASWRQRRDLTRACEAAATLVRSARASALRDEDPGGDDTATARIHAGAGLNAAARTAWLGYVARRTEILTAEQAARLDVMIEHPDSHRAGGS